MSGLYVIINKKTNEYYSHTKRNSKEPVFSDWMHSQIYQDEKTAKARLAALSKHKDLIIEEL